MIRPQVALEEGGKNSSTSPSAAQFRFLFRGEAEDPAGTFAITVNSSVGGDRL